MDRGLALKGLDYISICTIAAILIVFPVIFLPVVPDSYMFPKQLIIIAATLFLTLIWSLKQMYLGRVTFLSTPLNLPFFIFGVVMLCSAIFSQNRFDSLIQVIPVVVLIFFSFLVINLLERKESLQIALASLILGGTTSAVISILYFFHIYILPFQNPNNPAFTTFGSPVQHIAYLIPLFFYSSALVFAKLRSQNFERIALNKKNAFYVVCTSILLFGIGLNIFKIFFAEERPVIFPVHYGIQIATASLGQDTQRVLPSLLLGSGFGTFLTDFTRFKPMAFNSEPAIWNLNFNFSSNLILELISTTGILGVISFGFIIFKFSKIASSLKKWSLFNAVVSTFVLSFLVPYSYSFLFLLFILLSLFLVFIHFQKSRYVYPVNLSLVRPQDGLFSLKTSESPKRGSFALPLILCVMILIPLCFVSYFAIRLLQAEISFKVAQDPKTMENGQRAYDTLLRTIELFPYRDEYFRLFAQVNLSLANSLTEALKPGDQTSQDAQQTAFLLLQQSVNSGRSAVALAPLTVSNWTNLGKIYKSLIGVGRNAEQFSLAAYREAIKLNQYDSQIYIDTGGIFLQLNQYDAAVTQFLNATTLSPDLPNAHYNLGNAYEAKGDYEKALSEYELVKQLLQQTKNGTIAVDVRIESVRKMIDKSVQPASDAEPSNEKIIVGQEELLQQGEQLDGEEENGNILFTSPTPSSN